MTGTSDLEERLLAAVHEPSADLEALAHDVAQSDEAQVYLVELVGTLSALSPHNAAADRAAGLLEAALRIAAEHGITAAASAEAKVERSTGTRDPGDDRR